MFGGGHNPGARTAERVILVKNEPQVLCATMYNVFLVIMRNISGGGGQD